MVPMNIVSSPLLTTVIDIGLGKPVGVNGDIEEGRGLLIGAGDGHPALPDDSLQLPVEQQLALVVLVCQQGDLLHKLVLDLHMIEASLGLLLTWNSMFGSILLKPDA